MTGDSTILTMSYKTARRAAEFIMREFPIPDDAHPSDAVVETWADHNSETRSGILTAIINTVALYNGQPVNTDFLADQAAAKAFYNVEHMPNRTINGVDICIDDELIEKWRDLTPDEFESRMFEDSSMTAWLEGWEHMAHLHWTQPGVCGPECPALLPRQWSFKHLTPAQKFVFEAFIDHDTITAEDRERLAALLPTDKTTAA